jgi:hypothetical protein
MPVPGPHDDEFTVELEPDLWRRYREAVANSVGWKRVAEDLRSELEARLGQATAGTVEGKKVVYYRPADNWAVARIKADYPDLAAHFIRLKEQEVFDIEGFRANHPDIADKYQVRSFRSAE